ncbi:hypothetical protein ACFLVC_04485 [Chloroflexota bacterium]
MKHAKVFCILALVVSLSLLATVAIPATPALAQSITLSPTSGSLGTKVMVTGKDFASYKNRIVYLYFGRYQISSIKVPEGGNFTAYFNVPLYAKSGLTYHVAVKDGDGTILGRYPFIVCAKITLDPNEGKIGEFIKISGNNFNVNKEVRIYFSSDRANIGDYIDHVVTAYEYVKVFIWTDSHFPDAYNFSIPSELTNGTNKEDVHGGDYYFYATYWLEGKRIEAVAEFTVINGEIELEPEKGPVGTEVKISCDGLRGDQKITVRYDGNVVSGDGETDSDGQFSGTIIIPESIAGNHTITVIDESGNKPAAVFGVEPQITVVPIFGTAGELVKISGTGFANRDYITITLNGTEVLTQTALIDTGPNGSFSGSFTIPFDPSRVGVSRSKVAAIDSSFNTAEAQLTVLATPLVIRLQPTTNLTSPGYVGMDLTVDGIGFSANATVTVTYGNDETIPVATATTGANGNFSAAFTVPPSAAGSHTVTTTDDTNRITGIFFMESEAPPIPMPLLSQSITTAETKVYFHWEDVKDLSGVTHTLQVASDADFTSVVLEKKGLNNSGYTVAGEERLVLIGKEAPYYCRVKAIDGAFNESEWTPLMLLYIETEYVDSPQTSRPEETPSIPSILDIGRRDAGKWLLSIGIGLGLVGLILLILRLRR